MEKARKGEVQKLNTLKETLYEKQREMQSIQQHLEEISAKNSRLEQDFEKEINNKNQNSKEIGQIINSISNIAQICQNYKHGGKAHQPDKGLGISEGTKDLVQKLVQAMSTAQQTVQELVQVHETYGRDYDRNKAYAEDIDFERSKEMQKKGSAQVPARQRANAPGGGAMGRTGGISQGMEASSQATKNMQSKQMH